MKKTLTILFFMLWLSGCASVGITSTTFHGDGSQARGSVGVMPLDKTQENSLEFKTVSAYVQQKLVEKGYLDGSWKSSDYIAFVTYGIDTGKTSSTTLPIYGQTGGGASYSSGTLSSGGRTATYSGSTYSMPTYGVVGVVPVSQDRYRRTVNIDVFRWNGGKNPVKVYEMKGVSTGACGNINAVILPIIDGMFQNFPGESGKTKYIGVSAEVNCGV